MQYRATVDPVDALLAAWRTEYPDALDSTSELAKRVLMLAGALQEASRRVLPDYGLTTAEFDVLIALRRAGPPYRRKSNALAQSLLLSSGGTSNVTNHLVARGLVRREPDADDARSSWIRLTAEGRALAERAVRANTAAHHSVFADVPDPELAAATDALRAVFGSARLAARPSPPARAPRTSSAG